MAKRNRQSVQDRRNNKKQEKGRIVNEKHQPVTFPSVEAKTHNQKLYFNSLANNTITIASGHAGCGKGFCAAHEASRLLASKSIEKVIVTRPYSHLGKDYGAVPGTDWEKLEPFCRPILDVLKKNLGDSFYNYCVSHGMIEIAPLEKIQGRSFDEPCVVIADESQCASKAQLMSLVTRLGEGVKFLAIIGDPRQSIHKEDNALNWITSFFERNQIEEVGIIKFTEDDCVRSGIVKDILIAFEKEGGFYNTL